MVWIYTFPDIAFVAHKGTIWNMADIQFIRKPMRKHGMALIVKLSVPFPFLDCSVPYPAGRCHPGDNRTILINEFQKSFFCWLLFHFIFILVQLRSHPRYVEEHDASSKAESR